MRGYAYRSIGIETVEPTARPTVVGGRGLFETSAEFALRFGERFGGVAFVDAGFVSGEPQLAGRQRAARRRRARLALLHRHRAAARRRGDPARPARGTIRPSRSTSGSDRRFESGSRQPLGLLLLVALAALAQTTDDPDDNGFIVRFLEERISAPGRQIRLSGIQGALSSQARIGEITVSDAEGAWLAHPDVEIDWNRLELLLGRVNVTRLERRQHRLAAPARCRRPAAGCRSPEAAAQPFSLPELPVAIRLNELEPRRASASPRRSSARPPTSASAARSTWCGGALDTDLEIGARTSPGAS